MSDAAIYLRISTEMQDERNQLEECHRFCKQRGWEVVDAYIDRGSAFKKIHRPEWDRIMDHAYQGQFGHIVVWSLDRWTREGADALIDSLNRLNLWGVQLHSVQEQFLEDFNAGGELGKILREFISKVLAWQAQLESRRLSERVRAAHRRKVEAGEAESWGRPPAITYEQAIEAVERLGSVRQAARELGVSRATVSRHLGPVKKGQRKSASQTPKDGDRDRAV